MIRGGPESVSMGSVGGAVVGGRAGFLLDLTRCVGCGACVVACRVENDLPDTLFWRKILTVNRRRMDTGPTYHLSLACHHCDNPPCVKGCPSGALEKRPDGIVFIQEDLCLGCRYCEMTCPFGAPAFHEEHQVMTKCHLCLPRQTVGRQPACTQACPTGALHFHPDVSGAPDSFRGPAEVPGFHDPGNAGPNLKMAVPKGGIRAPRFEELRARVREAEEPTRG